MKKNLILSALALAIVITSCEKTEDIPSSMFKVTIENVMEETQFLSTGVFNTPLGASEPGGAGPGNSFQFSFDAGSGTKLSFATMFVKSNDLFYAPSDAGIDLFDNGVAISGDITSQIMLFDAGTEVNEEPGTGPNQPLNGGGATGTVENGMVKEISLVNDGFTYPSVSENIKVMIENDGATQFTVTIENLSGSSTPVAPGVYVLHSAVNALFEEGMTDYNKGLKGLAEAGDPSALADDLSMNSGYFSPLAPGVWAVHASGVSPIFMNNQMDMGKGLKDLAENGDPSVLGASLAMNTAAMLNGVFNTPIGSSAPGALLPGNSYEFSFEAEEGDYLSFASMLVHSNDLFFSPTDMGIALYSNGSAISGDITSKVMLYDAGTEVNEMPGVGNHQPARLNGGVAENGNVKLANDGFTYPSVSSAVKITITPM